MDNNLKDRVPECLNIKDHLIFARERLHLMEVVVSHDHKYREGLNHARIGSREFDRVKHGFVV